MKYRKIFYQLMKFGIVGAGAFFIDAALFLLLSKWCGVWYLEASFVSYCASFLFNYMASMRFVFSGKEGTGKRKEFLIFLLIALAALGFTELLMWIFVDIVKTGQLVAKLLSTIIVLIWNFVSRKILLDEEKVEERSGLQS